MRTSKLVQVLRSLIATADDKKQPLYLTFGPGKGQEGSMNVDINQVMANAGRESFDYGTFTAAYETDPRVKTMVANFDKDGIEAKTAEKTTDSGAEDSAQDQGGDDVEDLAQAATDLSSLGSNV